MGSKDYNETEIKQDSTMIITDKKAAIAMATCKKDTDGNRHVKRKYNYVRLGTSLKEHKFSWMGTKYQLVGISTKPSSHKNFSHFWDTILFHHDED